LYSIAGYDGYWSLDNTTNDLSGNSYNVQSGTVSFSTDGKKGTHSASFNGSSNYLQYSNGSFLNQAISFFLLNVGKTELAFRYSNYF
jgi:hypothetical protein